MLHRIRSSAIVLHMLLETAEHFYRNGKFCHGEFVSGFNFCFDKSASLGFRWKFSTVYWIRNKTENYKLSLEFLHFLNPLSCHSWHRNVSPRTKKRLLV